LTLHDSKPYHTETLSALGQKNLARIDDDDGNELNQLFLISPWRTWTNSNSLCRLIMRKLRASIFLARHKHVAAALATSVFEPTERENSAYATNSKKRCLCTRARQDFASLHRICGQAGYKKFNNSLRRRVQFSALNNYRVPPPPMHRCEIQFAEPTGGTKNIYRVGCGGVNGRRFFHHRRLVICRRRSP
jgi:hypothetical protein